MPADSVTIYDNNLAIGSNGVFSYRGGSIARGAHTYEARYPGTTDYAAVNSLPGCDDTYRLFESIAPA